MLTTGKFLLYFFDEGFKAKSMGVSMMGLFVFFLVSLSSGHAILNGQSVAKSEVLAQVSVKLTRVYNPSGPTDCSGTRIGHNYILTAAHCAAVANHVVFANGASFPVVWAKTHPDWDNNTDAFDFAVLYLEGNLPMGPVAELPNFSEGPPVKGDVLTVAGSGYTESGSDGELRKTALTVKNPNYSATEIFASGRRTGICGGDSGGGFVKVGSTIKIYGVSSSTVEADRFGCDDQVFMANVIRARDWIELVTFMCAPSSAIHFEATPTKNTL